MKALAILLLLMCSACGKAPTDHGISAKLGRTPECIPNPDPSSYPDGSYTDASGCNAIVSGNQIVSTKKY